MEIDVCSRYIWHGIVVADNVVLQPSAWLTVHDMTFSIWNNHTPAAERWRFAGDEVDLTLTYGKEWTWVSAELGFLYYVYPGEGSSSSTGEFSGRIALSKGPIELSTAHNVDVVRYAGAYFGEAQVAVEYELTRRLCAGLSTSIGWASPKFNETYVGTWVGAFNVLSVGASLQFQLSDRFYLKPHAEMYHTLHSQVAQLTQRTTTNIGGVLGIEW
ncbi:MAG: hypothetical protein V1784_08070 [bacterium]